MSMLAATFPLAMLAGFALAGRLAHARRTRAALLVGLCCLLAGSLTIVTTTMLPTLFAARAVMGVGSGCVWLAITFRTLQYWPGQQYLCMSRIYAAYSVGALVGPGLATLGGVRLPFATYATIVVVCLPLVVALPAPTAQTVTRDLTMIRTRGFWTAAIAIMFAITAIGTLDGVLPLHFATRLTQTQIGLAYTATAVLIAAASAAAGNTRPGAALTLGGVGIVGGIALAVASTTVPVWLGALALTGLGAGAAQTGATGMLLRAVPTERIVTAMVVWSQMGILGYLIAPALGGPLAAWLGFRWIGLLPLGAGVVLAAKLIGPHPQRTLVPEWALTHGSLPCGVATNGRRYEARALGRAGRRPSRSLRLPQILLHTVAKSVTRTPPARRSSAARSNLSEGSTSICRVRLSSRKTQIQAWSAEMNISARWPLTFVGTALGSCSRSPRSAMAT
jgi:MFS family permease